MKFFAAAAALAVATVAYAGAAPSFNDCSSNADLTISSFSISPYPLCVGKQVCATGTGKLSAPVTAPATLNVIGQYFGMNVYTDTQDLCALLAAQGHPCPVPVTLTAITSCINVKADAPTGIPVTLTVSATNGNGNSLFCQSASGVTAAKC
ncbi:hypothetical protein BGZ80_008492 [Entomortierella chlamydospora]|uniref:Phosphatidylglycerol/phosphatidylinositol transfer protein n=1 Tax=Entomortierella chlamydospora TaxID=101097 RepID=A0A9P6MYP6_9FUNG|nr:hypothetical protein BGZ79_004323 [Entomortierella chlamydospora]KAG0017251.1 hypothetical protein BGZ80_008492 [Entomortierella chlamydospora]